MEDYTNDPLHMNESGFIDAVYLFVWGNDDPCTEEYSFSHTIKELKTQFRRVSEAEQFAADLAIQAADTEIFIDINNTGGKF